jgi:NADH-quinone oxidoreductase subunit C
MPEKPVDEAALRDEERALRDRFPESVREAAFEKGELTVDVGRASLLEILRFLKFERGFSSLTDIIALDLLRSRGETASRFVLLYELTNFAARIRLRLRLEAGADESAPSAVPVFKSADWAEREIFDMFGLRFEGHPCLNRIYLPDEFEGHPLRKDFPLEGRGHGL